MDPWVRAADADREEVVTLLQQQVGTGRLTLDEFSERAAAAYRARTMGELAGLTRDLPPDDADRPGSTGRPGYLPGQIAAAVLAVALVLAVGVFVMQNGLACVNTMGAMRSMLDGMAH